MDGDGLPRYDTTFDSVSGIGTIAIIGQMDFQMFAGAMSHLWTEQGQTMSMLCDAREGDFTNLNAEVIRRAFEGFSLIRPDSNRCRCAYLVSRDVDFGFAKMIEKLGGELPIKIGAFRDFDEAWRWLSEAP
jgi:hypothetical protein